MKKKNLVEAVSEDIFEEYPEQYEVCKKFLEIQPNKLQLLRNMALPGDGGKKDKM